MRIRAIFAALAMFAVILRAQAPAPKPGTVEGVVTNSVTGEPLKKAAVRLAEKYTAMTDAVGHYRFDNVTPGNYLVTADKGGFQTTSGTPPQVTVAEGQTVKDVALKLLPLATVSGHVFDQDGEPIPRAQVAVLRYFYGLARKQLNPVAFAQSNDLGEFEALNLPPGRYYFQVTPPQPPRNIPPHTRWSHPEEAYPVTFHPNAREVAQATATDVATGAHGSN